VVNIKFTADRIIDLPQKELDELGISTMSVFVNIGGRSYEDMIDITLDEVYAKMKETGELAKTAAKSPEAYYDFFKPFAKPGTAIIHFAAASGTSAICANAIEASKRLENVYVFDTRTLSCGIAAIAKYAVDLARNGETDPKKILEKCEAKRQKLQFSFVIDSLECLHKGGRCSALKYGIAKLLRLKPAVTVSAKTANMEVREKFRGNLKKSLSDYIRTTFKKFANPDLKDLYVMYTSKNDEALNHVVDTVKTYHKFEKVHLNAAGCNAGIHSGPNTFGLCYFVK